MTVAAVKVSEDKIEIGCDSIMLSGDIKNNHSSKIREASGLMFVGAGHYQEVVMLDLFIAEKGTPKEATEANFLNFIFSYNNQKKDKGFVDDDKDPSFAEWIFVYENRVFFSSYYTVTEIKSGFHAIGAGREIAIGALAVGASVQEAIEVACEYCSSCDRSAKVFTILKIKE